MHDLPHVASRVFGTPLMIAQPKLEVILGAMAPRLFGAKLQQDMEAEPRAQTTMTAEGIAVVPVVGTLVSRSGHLDATSGLLSYRDIGDVIAGAMDDPLVRGIILDVDSSGGEVGGLFDLVEQIGTIRPASGKPLWAVANERALSAAYAIASTANRLYVVRTGEVGSIGVVAVHIDESGADAKAGQAWTFLFAGERKIDGNAHAALSDLARAAIQADVDRIYADLCGLVATNRRLNPESIRATNAAIYRGELAVKAGLADRIGTLDQALAEMAAELDDPRATTPLPRSPTHQRSPAMATETAPTAVTEEQPEDAPPDQPAPPEAHAIASRLRAEFADLAALAAQAARLGVTVDAADAVRKGIAPDALRRSILDTLASRAEASSIVAAAPPTATTGDSPIVKRAKERAAAIRS